MSVYTNIHSTSNFLYSVDTALFWRLKRLKYPKESVLKTISGISFIVFVIVPTVSFVFYINVSTVSGEIITICIRLGT